MIYRLKDEADQYLWQLVWVPKDDGVSRFINHRCIIVATHHQYFHTCDEPGDDGILPRPSFFESYRPATLLEETLWTNGLPPFAAENEPNT